MIPAYADYFSSTVTDGCGQDTLGVASNVTINAKFEPINITCDNGQYLPANSVVCVSCPNEATCTAGTYPFNETKNQGIVYDNPFQGNKQTGCTTNLLGIGTIGATVTMVAKYRPNIINLNWYNGDTSVAQTTCTYDNTITLQPAPVRPGYTFVGWRLKTDSQTE